MGEAAVVNFAPERHAVELREVPTPEIGAADVRLEVGAVGVCGSDLHQWLAEHSWPVNYPVVLGHEFGGVVTQVGRDVAGWKEGDRVVSETAAVIDLSGPMTRRGLYNLDPTRLGFGYGVNGAMTKHVRVPSRCLHRVPDGLPFEKAALTEPCSVAYNATVMNADVQPGDRIVVLGPGRLACCARPWPGFREPMWRWWDSSRIKRDSQSPDNMVVRPSLAIRATGHVKPTGWGRTESSMPRAFRRP